MLSKKEFIYTVRASLLACFFGCQGGTSEPVDAPSLTAQVTYHYDWDRRDVTFIDGARWQVINNQGYMIQIEQGHVVNFETALVPCPVAEKTSWGLSTHRWAHLIDLVSVTPAHAGHGDIADQSALTAGFVEFIGGPSIAKTIDRLMPATYCDVHYLIARADPMTLRDDAMPDMTNRSLFIEGQYKAPGEQDWTAFVVDSSIAYGILRSHAQAPPTTETIALGESKRLNVNVRRPMKSMFQDVNFDGMNSSSIARLILRNLLEGTQLEHDTP